VPDYLDGTLAGECVPCCGGCGRRQRCCACKAWLGSLLRFLPTCFAALRSYGYDPLGLGKDGNVEKYREYEVRRCALRASRAGWRLTDFPVIAVRPFARS
jgi:hypothetical protein